MIHFSNSSNNSIVQFETLHARPTSSVPPREHAVNLVLSMVCCCISDGVMW